MSEKEQSRKKIAKEVRQNYGPAFRLAVISLVLCGLVFPLLVTGFAQVLMPSQANGSIVSVKGHSVGSSLIAQNFTLPIFFHPRNNSASGVDPHITLDDAYSQIPRIHLATNIDAAALKGIVDANIEGPAWLVGYSYVNVLTLNLVLIRTFPFYATYNT